MRNITVRFERTKTVAGIDSAAFDVSGDGELVVATDGGKFYKGGAEISLDGDDNLGTCVSVIEDAAAFSSGAVVNLDWAAGVAEVVGSVEGNDVRVSPYECVNL